MGILWHESTLTAGTNFNGKAINYCCNPAAMVLALKSVAKSANWTVGRSGDGGAISATSDVFSAGDSLAYNGAFNIYGEPSGPNSPTIARSFENNLSHFSLIPPNSDGELTIQNVDIGDGYVGLRIKFSAGGYAGSNATQQPAPTTVGDEQIILGGGTNSSPSGEYVYINPRGADGRLVIGASDDATAPFLYMVVSNNTAITFCLLWCTVTGRLASGDTSASMVHVGLNAPTTAFLSSEGSLGATSYGFAGRFGSSDTIKQPVSYPCYGGLNASLVRSLGKQFAPGAHYRQRSPQVLLRNPYSASPRGLKGRLNDVSWCLYDLPQFHVLGNTLASIPGDSIVVGDLLLPYNQFGTHGAGGLFHRR